MASSRDDFIIAIRSAFLKKSTKQKFSLLTLVFLSIFIIVLSNINFKPINTLRSIINEIVYRSSFIVSIPENFLIKTFLETKQYTNFYLDYKQNKIELEKIKSENISSEIIRSENEELKELIEDFTLTTNKILAKVIVDHDSPFLKTIIINKGSVDNIKLGTNIFDKDYLVGRVIEVNYKSSRVLLLSDLNSSVPVSIIPGNIQAIVNGNGKIAGEIKYIKDNLINEIQDQSIVYTSGTGSIFDSGTPIGRINFIKNSILVNFYSDFTQLKYVFAEVEQVNNEIKIDGDTSTYEKGDSVAKKNTENLKLDILNENIEILEESNSKFIEENQVIRSENDQLKNQILILNEKIDSQKLKIKQNNIDQKELEFLRLNLIYSSKCQKKLFKQGYKVGTEKYRKCIFNRGKIND